MILTDIGEIKKELKDHNKIELPYAFDENCHIKYLTLKNKEEYFYTGGKFVKQTGNRIILTNNGNTWSVPTILLDKDGNIIYKTTFFIMKSSKQCDQKIEELKKIIETQQSIIKKMTKHIQHLEKK